MSLSKATDNLAQFYSNVDFLVRLSCRSSLPNFVEICPVEAALMHTDRRNDGRTDKAEESNKLFRRLCERPKDNVLPTQLYLCVLCGSENKQRLFPYTTLTL